MTQTLSRAMTAQFFASADDYAALKRHWSTLVNGERKKDLKAAHYLLYAILMGRDWRKGFTPVTRAIVIANGGWNGWGLFKAHSELNQSTRSYYRGNLLNVFDGLVTREMVAKALALLPDLAGLEPGDDIYTLIPEAYCVPEEVLHAST